MTIDTFGPIFALLASQLRATDADEATIRAYHKGLDDLEPEFVAMAATQLAATAEWFPKTSEWRRAALKVERDREDELRARLRKRPEPLCLVCGDTGWRDAGILHADRGRGGVTPCECRADRRLEVLGRRPMPPWPAALGQGDGEGE